MQEEATDRESRIMDEFGVAAAAAAAKEAWKSERAAWLAVASASAADRPARVAAAWAAQAVASAAEAAARAAGRR